MDCFIHADHVSFRYEEQEDGREVLHEVELSVRPGEFLALLGHNGSGKSTLAKQFNAMLLPSGGRVLVDGMDTAEEALRYEIRRRVGLVLQNPDNQLVASIVEEDVAFGPENLGVEPGEIRRRVDDALRVVEMTDYHRHATYKLSGGQKQRVAIAGIIAMQPKCVVLDEPTAMLDPRGRTEVLRTIHKLNREKGITVILITHYMDEAVSADRVVVMDNGRILTEGTPREVFSQVKLLKEHHLDVPQATELIDRLRNAGCNLPGGVLNEDECVAVLSPLLKTARDAPASTRVEDTEVPRREVERGAPLIETKDLRYVYGAGTPFEKTAVDGVNLSIQQGEMVGVIGHTGSGKSTLVQLLNGLLRPTSGQVLLDGRDIWSDPKKIRDVRFRVGMVFQYPEHQLFEETVAKDIAFGPKNMGLDEKEIERRVQSAAAFTGLPEELLEQSPFELSGGEKRRAAIAGVMAMDPDVLILDEPTAGLDPSGRELLLSQIVAYHRERKNTVLLVSHSMEDIARIADRVLVMNDGRAAMMDSTREVFAHGEELAQMGLRVPQITTIMQRLREQGIPVSAGVLTVKQAVEEVLRLLHKRGDRPW